MKNISFAPVRALYLSYDDEWTREHPARVWDEAKMDALLAIGPANLSEEQLDSLSESEALQLILSDSAQGQILSDGGYQFLFDEPVDNPYRRHLRKLVEEGVFPKSDLPATTAGTLMAILRGKAERERETRTDLDNTMAFAMRAGIMSARGISRMTGLSHVTVARRANEADDAAVNDLVSAYHFYAAEEGEYAAPDESIHATDSEQDDLDRLAELGRIREEAEEEIESLSRGLIERRVPHRVIADAARVHRVTVARWKRAMKEGN